MASVDNQLEFNFANCGGSPRFPQASMQFNWREDPAILVLRHFTRQKIAIFLAKNASGGFDQVIQSLAAEFESRIFSVAGSKEEYLNEGALFDWLQFLIQDKLLSNNIGQQEVYCSTSSALPPLPLPKTPFMEAPKRNSSTNLADVLPASCMAASPAFDMETAKYYTGPRSWHGSQTNYSKLEAPAAQGRNLTSEMVPLSPDQVTSELSFPGKGQPHAPPVDSSLTFSGSVLQYESEASFESNCKPHQFSEGELDSIVATKQNSSFVHVPSTMEQSITLDGSRSSSSTSKGCFNLPMVESQHFVEQFRPIFPLSDPFAGKSTGLLRYQVDDDKSIVVQPDGQSTCPSSSVSYGPCSITDDLSKNLVAETLLCYRKFQCNPVTSELGQAHFLQFLHSEKCLNKCTCNHFKSLLCHFDGCASRQCRICGPLLDNINEELRLETMNPRNSNRKRSWGNHCMEAMSQISCEAFQDSSKCRKLNSFAVKCDLSLTPCPVSPRVPPNSKHCSEPLLSLDGANTKLSTEMNANHTKKLICVDESKNDYVDNKQKLEFSNSSPNYEELVEEHKLKALTPSFHRQRSWKDIALEYTSQVNCEPFPGPSKKLNNFASEDILLSGAHCSKVSQNPNLSSGSPLSMDSDDSKLSVKRDAVPTKNSTLVDDSNNNCMDNEQINESLNGSLNSEESPSCKENEIEVCEDEDKFLENSPSPSSKAAASLSQHGSIVQNEDTMIGSDLEKAKQCNMGLSETDAKSEKLKMQGVSLTEFFTAEEVKQHMLSLRQKFDQTAAEQEIGKTMDHFVSDNFCQLCDSDKLWFPPVPIYCSACGSRVKYRGTYYSMLDENSAQFCLCSACHNKSRGVNKLKMEMKKNDVVTEEAWVQCDKCEGWQHQICALFNDKRDLEGKAEYICPKCYLEELEAGECNPLPWTTCFGANNLPCSALSDHLEQRLMRQLKREREDRAKAHGKNLEEVPEATDLVVRVVSSVDKILKVKQQFLDIFSEKNYPSEFPYRSKVILLFQRIEGVDVCLFGLYVQEFGSECNQPNQRCLYISYLDSVKYFGPETRTVSGEALRTYVYHEILIGYLEYCKNRGFSTCYIWACPPVKGEDYILYCHPEVQKTPKPDKLRQWYQSMLRKAVKEKIVVNFTNIYEQFFVPNEGCNAKVTAARLPYFDGDYWSSVAENVIKKIEQECGGDLQKKVKKITRRSLKAMGHTNPSDGDAKDILLMQELGQSISSAKEDFIIVYLQHVCTHCHEVIATGKRWYCNQCRNFQLCEGCHAADLNFERSHISSSGQKHELCEEVVNDVPANTEDNDVILSNCFLENRHALLSFCQGNHYQFDTLRRAKHSSMMILYHLHHPTVSTTGMTSCCLCLRDIGAGPRWKCELCPEFNVCSACYQRNGIGCHTHNLSQHSLEAGIRKESMRADMIRELLNVVRHASRCLSTARRPCNYPNCLLIRRLFSHAHYCNIRVVKGCVHCKKVWQVLIMHFKNCGDPDCDVPRCRDLKKGFGERSDLRNETWPPETKPDPNIILRQ